MPLYHYKMGPVTSVGGDGDGTKANPWYWYGRNPGNSNRTIDLNNENTSGDNRRLYIRVKLNADTTYYIGQTRPGDGDGRIWLYNENGEEITNNDDDWNEIAGIECSDSFEYTPETTGIYIIGAGSYGDASGDYTVAVDPSPESDPVPVSGLLYSTSEGFDNFGFSIPYDSAVSTKLNVIKIPIEGLIFYASLSKNTSYVAETGQELSLFGQDVVYQTVDGIPCVYLNGNQYFNVTIGNGASSINTISFWMNCKDFNDRSYFSSQDQEHYMIFSDIAYYPPHNGWNVSLSTNTWYHICITTEERTRNAYVNAINVESSNWGESQAINNIRIGARGIHQNPIYGYMSSVRVYNRILSEDEIILLANEFTPTNS